MPLKNPLAILIIDDNPDDREQCLRAFKKIPNVCYRCQEAQDGQKGLDTLANKLFDCVLLDYSLPGMNGLEVLKEIRTRYPFLPVILLTGQGNEAVAVTAMKLGSQDYIPKKILNPSALQRAVERAVEHVDLVRRMEQYRNDLERSNHDLEQFANIVAHDLKSPLRAVTQHLTLILHASEAALDEKSKRSLHFAVEGAERMRLLIDALFEYARLGFSEPHLSAVKMEDVLEHNLQDLSALIEERDAIITHDPLPEVTGDEVLLSQLLQNLLANGIKYCKTTPHIHISASKEGKYWRISVQDNGIGIAPAQHQQIFAIFRRLHQSDEYPGIGLGLAICKRIIEQHGGIIRVVSAPDKGSCFSFTVPSTAALSPEPPQEQAYG